MRDIEEVVVGVDDEWWFNLVTQHVEQGLGAPNAQRLGPYETEAEAAGALERMRERNEAWDAADRDGTDPK